MLIIPAEHSPDRENLPWITFFFIAINVLIFFGYQGYDDQRMNKAKDIYFSTILPGVEIPAYADYLIESQNEVKLAKSIEDTQQQVFIAALTDLDFGEYVKASSYYQSNSQWMQARNKFENARNQISSYRFGFNVKSPTVSGVLGSAFMHGGIMHLLGNMVFLFIFGFSLEIILGRGKYFVLYLLSGVVPLAFYWAISNINIPLIGASGAIASLMGMYLAVYGSKKIRFFYWIYFTLGYFRVSALVILPIWIGKELWGLEFANDNVGYGVHLGGLIFGFLIIFLAKQFKLLKLNNQYINKNEQQQYYRQKIVHLEKTIGSLDQQKTIVIAKDLLVKYPNDKHIFDLVYNALKMFNNQQLTVLFYEYFLRIELNNYKLQEITQEILKNNNNFLANSELQLILLNKLIKKKMIKPALMIWSLANNREQNLVVWPKLSLLLARLVGDKGDIKTALIIGNTMRRTHPDDPSSKTLFAYLTQITH